MAKTSSFTGEVLHFGAVRYRVTGSGNLQTTLFSLNDVNSDSQVNIPMQASTDVEPVLIANFTNQRAYLLFKTTNINEIFSINKIYIFIKPVATGYPQ